MTLDADSFSSAHSLIQRLEEYNPWWNRGQNTGIASDYPSLRKEFYRAYEFLHTDEQRLLPIVGMDGVGKSRLLHQLVAAHIDSDFIEKYFRDPTYREQAHENLVPPSNILYIPLHDDPVYQLTAEAQLRAAVDHFETHVLRQTTDPHYLLFDDLHTVERPNRRGNQNVGRWERLLTELLTDHENRQLIFTALSSTAVRERLSGSDITPSDNQSVQEPFELKPLGFADFLRMRYRDLELAPPAERFDEKAVTKALLQAVTDGNPGHLVSVIEAQQADAALDASTVRREIANYCTTGGMVAHRIVREGVSVRDERFVEYIRSRGESDFEGLQQRTLADLRDALLRATTNLGGVKDAAGIERFCALAAHELPVDDILFDDLTAVLDLDRRTVRSKYLSTLSQLNLLSDSQEYDNQRPRKLRFSLRDPGITNAFRRNDLTDVLRRQPGLDEALAKVVAFDHTTRLSNELNHRHDPKRGVVKFWPTRKGAIDFIPKLGGRPIPILWSYNETLDDLMRGTDAHGFDALREFLASEVYESERDPVDASLYRPVQDSFEAHRREYVQRVEYAGRLDEETGAVVDGEPPFGVVLTNARAALDQGVTVTQDMPKPIIQIPLWTYLRLQ